MTSDSNQEEEQLTFEVDDAVVEEGFSEVEVVVLIQILLRGTQQTLETTDEELATKVTWLRPVK